LSAGAQPQLPSGNAVGVDRFDVPRASVRVARLFTRLSLFLDGVVDADVRSGEIGESPKST